MKVNIIYLYFLNNTRDNFNFNIVKYSIAMITLFHIIFNTNVILQNLMFLRVLKINKEETPDILTRRLYTPCCLIIIIVLNKINAFDISFVHFEIALPYYNQ